MIGDCLKNTCLSAEINAQRIFMRPSAGLFLAGTAKKCTKQRDARAEFSKQCLLNLLPFHVGDGDGHENIAYKVNQCVLSISNAIIPIRVLCQMQANSDSGAELKTCVFLAPIRSQNGGDRLELVW